MAAHELGRSTVAPNLPAVRRARERRPRPVPAVPPQPALEPASLPPLWVANTGGRRPVRSVRLQAASLSGCHRSLAFCGTGPKTDSRHQVRQGLWRGQTLEPPVGGCRCGVRRTLAGPAGTGAIGDRQAVAARPQSSHPAGCALGAALRHSALPDGSASGWSSQAATRPVPRRPLR